MTDFPLLDKAMPGEPRRVGEFKVWPAGSGPIDLCMNCNCDVHNHIDQRWCDPAYLKGGAGT